MSIAAIGGLGVVALVVTFLFSLYGSYQRREMRVVMLQASAGAPPSAVALLESYAHLDLVDRLPDLFRDWQQWAAEVLDSHVAYPLLGFFRSSHDNLSWISALGTVLDASSLVLTTIDDLPRGDAKLFKRMGTHLVEDISNLGLHTGTTEPPRPDRFRGWCAIVSHPPDTPSRRATLRGRVSRRRAQRIRRGSKGWRRTGRRRRPSGWAIRSNFASHSIGWTIRKGVSTKNGRPSASRSCRFGLGGRVCSLRRTSIQQVGMPSML